MSKEVNWEVDEIIILKEDYDLSQLPHSPRCKNLLKLSIQVSGFTKIPPTFFEHMPFLEELDLSTTNIQSLPSSISSLTLLQRLFLRDCSLLMELPSEIGMLMKLKLLDCEGSEIMYIPKEIGELSDLEVLRFSLSLYADYFLKTKCVNDSVKVPRNILSKLTKLKELCLTTCPEVDSWEEEIRDIQDDLCHLENLQTLKWYLPTKMVLQQFLQIKIKGIKIYQRLSNFTLTIGRHPQLTSCLPADLQKNFETLEKYLKWINAEGNEKDVSMIMERAKALFLSRHWTIVRLSDFDLTKLRYCLLAECNEMETLVEVDVFSEDVKNVEIVGLESIEYLTIHNMQKFQSIWRGPMGKDSLSRLRILALHTCPKLTTIFTINIAQNLSRLTELTVEDCSNVTSLISNESPNIATARLIPCLEKIFLLDLPELHSISSGNIYLEKVDTLLVYNCLKLKYLSVTELPNIQKIKGENDWWNDLKCDKSRWQNVFEQLKEEMNLIKQLAEATNSLQHFHDILSREAKDEKHLDCSALGVSDIKSHKSNFLLKEQEGVSLSRPDTSRSDFHRHLSAADLIGEAALHIALSELQKVVIEQTCKTSRFKSLLKRLGETLERIKRRLYDNSSERLRRLGELEMVISYLGKAKKLVLECPKIHVWNVYKMFLYQNKLIHLEDELLRLFQIDVPLSKLKNILRVETLGEKLDRALPLGHAITRAGGFSGSCGVPGLPDLIIGLEQHLVKLKSMLLEKDTRVLVVSAPGGYGKTTLAKMLCHDDEIKGIFGENIIYVTVSASPNLENITKKIFDHFGTKYSPFQSEDDAKNQLENLLEQTGSNKLLLVMDDAWAGSEYIVSDLVFQSTGLIKILVTSRFLFPRFSNYELSLLNKEDAKTLLIHSAFQNDGFSVNVPDDIVDKIVETCKGLPLALIVVGASLRGEPRFKWEATLKKWSDGQSILQSHEHLLRCLQTSIDELDELPCLKECFLDLGSFPENDKIAGTALLDMWVELYGLDSEGMYASENLLDLSLRNLVKLIPIRIDARYIEDNYCEHYVTQHHLLRELAIHLNDQTPIAERKRLFMEIHRDDLPKWWIEQTEQPINARIISISTDEAFSSSWYDLHAPCVDVLILNIRSKNYALPQFIKRMSQLKVLIVTGYGYYPTRIGNLYFLGSLTNLRRIRFEHVSVSPSIQVIFTLQNLKKLTFVTCEIGNALKSDTTEYPNMLPNLVDLEIDRCNDLKELPSELCNIVHLEKLGITNCPKLEDLPKGLGSLSKLQTLQLRGCTKLQLLPESIGNLHNLSLIDISDCLSVSALPEQFGELTGLRVLNMTGSQGLQELPVSMSKLSQLEDVICNEETSYLWKNILRENSNVKINIIEEDRLENFRKICQ